MIFRSKFDAAEALSLMPRATALMGVPTFYTRLLAQSGLAREAVAGMRRFISGSAPLLAEVHRDWSERTGTAILERYGMTETGMNTSNPYDGDRVAGTVGFPLPDVALRIADPETGAPLATGEIGMIEVKGPNVFAGYWNMPEKTAAEFRPDGFFITGDLGTIDPRGYVSIVGRGKDLIISGGFNVYPKEVEEELDALPGVGPALVDLVDEARRRLPAALLPTAIHSLRRLADYQEKSRTLRLEGAELLDSWNRLIERTIPATELRADSPTLPTNQQDAADAPRPAGLDTTELIQIQPAGK